MASRRRSFQATEGPPPHAIQLVHEMIQAYNCYDPWSPGEQDILNYRSADCLHEFIPMPSGRDFNATGCITSTCKSTRFSRLWNMTALRLRH
ncbi:hypothetical protein MAPG_04144 [Magnaporthiopsis poae ATCC 64411]|uniref:Uncharacterized protein n=1 Tax=Magnaporthiopsis poae (strain ATCC 64411 / 73-15) TaxID=644358 RepID=A0A0C4DVX8_MAGP6|nr:hypothetical protein MAPG_04144 [Magnaporthiopsis poae ATCC 64411]